MKKIFFISQLFLFLAIFINLFFSSIEKAQNFLELITVRKVSEKIYGFVNFIFYYKLTSWKQYLKEKFRTKKEKLARAKTWAWKHEGKLSAIKGFYIPTVLPQTDQAKFFLKKWDEDEQKLRDQELNINKKNRQPSPTYYKDKEDLLQKNQTSEDLLRETLKLTIIKPSKIGSNFSFSRTKQANLRFSNTKFLKNQITDGFTYKFSKKFLKTPVAMFKISQHQHIWSYLNIGSETSEFLNFFFIHYFPISTVNFNFLKNKILLSKWFKALIFNDSWTAKNNLNYKNNSFFTMFVFSQLKNTCFFSRKKQLINIFNFLNIFKNWQMMYQQSLFLKNYILINLIGTTSLFYKTIMNLLNIIKFFFYYGREVKKQLLAILLSRVWGFSDFIVTKSKIWKKNLLLINFHYIVNANNNSNLVQVGLYLKNFNLKTFNLIPHYTFNFLEFFYTKFNILLSEKFYFSRTPFQIFFENFAVQGSAINRDSFFDSKKLSKTFFIFLRNWIKYYENIRFLLYTSFSQQIKIIDEINVADVLFKYIIWKGKKLTARTVFLKFLKKFKKKYSLPALPIFTHALLHIEPKVWLKEKKIAGKLYEIPIYISPSWSKWIAVRWLLQAAKKWKRASITDSLAQEVWDACLKKGGAFNNKETVHLTVKKNKAYLRWF